MKYLSVDYVTLVVQVQDVHETIKQWRDIGGKLLLPPEETVRSRGYNGGRILMPPTVGIVPDNRRA